MQTIISGVKTTRGETAIGFSLKRLFKKETAPPPPGTLKPFDWNAFDHVRLMQGEEAAIELITPGYDFDQPNYSNETPLEDSLHWHKVLSAMKFIKCGASVSRHDKDGLMPLYHAAGWGDMEMVQLLLKKGADPSDGGKPGCSPMTAAAANGRIEIMQVLLARGAGVDGAAGVGWTPLMAAARRDDQKTEALEFLLKQKPALDVQDDRGDTALMYAIFAGNHTAVQMLANAGATLDLRNAKGETAFQKACNTGRGEAMAAQLLAAGADPTIPDSYGITPLICLAATVPYAALFETLLKRNVPIDVQDSSGQSALMWAVNKGNKTAVEKLLAAGANPMLANVAGATALQYAQVPFPDGRMARDPEIARMVGEAQKVWTERQQREAAAAVNTNTVLQKDMPLSHAIRLRHKP